MKSLKCIYKVGHGPSSSHTIGPSLAVEIFKNKHPECKKFKCILYGSLALTGKGHLTDKIIIETFSPFECDVVFDIKTKCEYHPNTMDLIAVYDDHEESTRFYSIGGGDLEIEGESKPVFPEIYEENTFDEIKEYCNRNKISLVEYVNIYEHDEIRDYLSEIYDSMVKTINKGLNTEGELPGSLHLPRRASDIYSTVCVGESLAASKFIYSYAYATSEENASGGIVVTAPTCGSSGLLPAVLYYAEHHLKYSRDKIIDALQVAGIIGNVIKTNGSISGAEAGCQAEVGAACSMAAGAFAYLLGANIDEIEQAAEIALEHHLGLTCDPVNGEVQIPCIERNAVCAVRAIDAAELVIFIKPQTCRVSLDIVIKTMKKTGHDLSSKYRETAKGGLAKEIK